jgi:hypothetical protein
VDRIETVQDPPASFNTHIGKTVKTWKSIEVRVLIVGISFFSFCSSVKVLDGCVKEFIVLVRSYCICLKTSDKGGNSRIYKTNIIERDFNGMD